MHIRIMTSLTALGLALAAAPVSAASCSGMSSRTSAAPVVAHEAEDGTTTMLIRSTGSSTELTPEQVVSWQHCVGLWTVKPDGGGEGAGTCYEVHVNGDIEVTAWEGANAAGAIPEGTWTFTRGTGEWSDRTATGTWKNGPTLAGGLAIGHWEGDCSE